MYFLQLNPILFALPAALFPPTQRVLVLSWGSGSFELEIKILPRHLLSASWNRETGWGTMTRFSGLRCNPKLRHSKGIASVIYRQFWEARTVPRWR